MRTQILSASIILALTAIAPAQATLYRTSPPGWLTTEAGLVPGITTNPSRACFDFGAYPEYETQIIDGHTRGKRLQLIKQLDYRLNYWGGHKSDGRTWANVSLDMGTGRYDKSTTTFTTNFTRTPTRVFSGTVTWPGVTGQPCSTAPCPWGREVSFPFRASWPQTNIDDTIHHYKFSGGKLSSTATWDQDNANRYYLDAAFVNEASTGYQHPYNVGTGCIDTNQPSNPQRACNAYIYNQTFSKDSFTRPDKFRLDRGIFNGAPSTMHARVHGVGRANPPVPFPGVTCNGIGIDLTKFFWIDVVTTNASGGHRQIVDIPYVPGAAGVTVHFQVAWADTATKAMKLARPNRVKIAAQPDGLMAVVYKIGTKTTVLNQSMQRIPLTRYSYN